MLAAKKCARIARKRRNKHFPLNSVVQHFLRVSEFNQSLSHQLPAIAKAATPLLLLGCRHALLAGKSRKVFVNTIREMELAPAASKADTAED